MNMTPTALIRIPESRVVISTGEVTLEGELEIPPGAPGIVIFTHGCGSSRQSPRDRFIAGIVRQAGFGTLLFDLLTLEEEREDGMTGAICFDITLLAERLAGATRWLENQPRTRDLMIGYFGANTGGSAAFRAAAELGDRVAALVSRGCRADLVNEDLSNVRCPTRLIVGAYDEPLIQSNEKALGRLGCRKELRIIPGAGHLFEEPGKLEQVARISANWFGRYMNSARRVHL
jgi:putative phosphoribosyl transferase